VDAIEAALNALSEQAWDDAEAAGWHGTGKSCYDDCLLIHSEVSELFECLRRGTANYVEVDGKPEGPASELADIIIRTLELAYRLNVDIGSSVAIKMSYNRYRKDVPRHSTEKLI
jgi:NTP pyrophosphatase (non-canonical NTP hydrolase)